MRKVRQKINADEFHFHFSDTNEEIKFLLGLLYFRSDTKQTTIQNDTKQTTRELWYGNFSARNVYRAIKLQ